MVEETDPLGIVQLNFDPADKLRMSADLILGTHYKTSAILYLTARERIENIQCIF